MKLKIWTLQSQHSHKEDISFKIVKENADANFILQNFNQCIIDGTLPDHSK